MQVYHALLAKGRVDETPHGACRSATPPPYRVRLVPTPAVIDAQDHILTDAQILEIRLPGDRVET